MLLFFDEYIAEYPRRQVGVLKKFETAPEYLHKMTSPEVNEFAKDWQPVIQLTANKHRRFINQYLTWLADEKSVEVVLDARKIEFPTESQFAHYIFNTDDLHNAYEMLGKAAERAAALANISQPEKSVLMTHVTDILMFYGLTEEQILALDLSDIQKDGVAGYDLPLTEKDIEILLEYKNLTVFSNNVPLLGTKYIRTTYTGEIISPDPRFFSRSLDRMVIEKEYAYLKTLLKPNQVALMGKFNRVYEYEKTHNEMIRAGETTPAWFRQIMEISGDWISTRKKDYLEYREARNNR